MSPAEEQPGAVTVQGLLADPAPVVDQRRLHRRTARRVDGEGDSRETAPGKGALKLIRHALEGQRRPQWRSDTDRAGQSHMIDNGNRLAEPQRNHARQD